MTTADKKPGIDKPGFDGEWVRLEDVCAKGKSNLRQKDLKNDGPYPVYGAPGIVGFSSDYQNADAYVAVVKDGAGVGRVMACEPRSSVLGTMQALLPGKGTDRDYLLHLVRSMDLGKGFTGSTIPHIYFKDYGKTLVRALSRGRQVEVANRLSGFDRRISQGTQQRAFLDELDNSQFVEMFGDPCEPSPCSFPRVALKEVCELRTGPFGSALHKEDYVPGCHPLVNPSHVVDCQIVIDKNLTVDDDTYDSMKPYHLHIGDVVLGRRGEIGRCAVVSAEGLLCGTGCMIVRPNGNACRSDYLQRVFSFPSFASALEREAVGVTMKNLNAKIVGNAVIAMPPLALQQQFADFVARVYKLGFDVQQQIEKLETLKQSLMQEYFG